MTMAPPPTTAPPGCASRDRLQAPRPPLAPLVAAVSRGGSTRRWRRLRALVLDRDGARCQVPAPGGGPCGAFASHVDHIRPRSLGGNDDPANLRAACPSCNLRRGARSISPDEPAPGSAADLRRDRSHPGWRW